MVPVWLIWYVVVQLLSLIALPLSTRFFRFLPDRGYSFAKSLGILLVGYVLWVGTSYGLLRNDTGGAWLATGGVAIVSIVVGWQPMRVISDKSYRQLDWRYISITESLFLLAYCVWVVVRMYDPAVDHTEEPMDLMFMNSIWVSPTYPPQDAWLAGYVISYYYFGYWLLVTIGRLAGQPPEVAYILGQATWFGLLLVGSFGLVCNLLAFGREGILATPVDDEKADVRQPRMGMASLVGGGIAALAVGVTGNIAVIPQWLYANGVNIGPLARLFGDTNDLVETGKWYIGFDWWWWRNSRVLSDVDFCGQHIEVIDEFPFFSYLLGDNHPHVLAMPFVILVLALALNLYAYLLLQKLPGGSANESGMMNPVGAVWHVFGQVAFSRGMLVLIVVALGALVFLNTWDYPPYWLLMVAVFFVGGLQRLPAGMVVNWAIGQSLARAAVFGGVLIASTLVLYLPYWLTAQSQAGGIVPNLFYPTRFYQFLLMFGGFVPAIAGLFFLLRPMPSLKVLAGSVAVVLGIPILFLLISALMATATEFGRVAIQSLRLPDGESYVQIMATRWSRHFLTFLVTGGGLAFTIGMLWQRIEDRLAGDSKDESSQDARLAKIAPDFVLMLLVIGLALVFMPEFVYLRDNFGTRMNTVFKFYYQGWLILGLCSAYAISLTFQQPLTGQVWPRVLGGLSAGLIGLGLIFPLAGVYSRTQGFGRPEPILNAIAHIGQHSPDEMAAIAWVRANTELDAVVLEGKGNSYSSLYNRISTTTGRPTLLGWEGHERQWRGAAYGEMSAGRANALETIYRSGVPEQIEAALDEYDIDYVYVGPIERAQYELTPRSEERLQTVMDLVFERGAVRIYRRR